MGKFNNYGGRIGKQNGDAGSFNNFGCIIGEQVVNNSKPNKAKKNERKNVDWEEFGRRMRELAERMRNMRRG